VVILITVGTARICLKVIDYISLFLLSFVVPFICTELFF